MNHTLDTIAFVVLVGMSIAIELWVFLKICAWVARKFTRRSAGPSPVRHRSYFGWFFRGFWWTLGRDFANMLFRGVFGR